jgi:hypothetical protein
MLHYLINKTYCYTINTSAFDGGLYKSVRFKTQRGALQQSNERSPLYTTGFNDMQGNNRCLVSESKATNVIFTIFIKLSYTEFHENTTNGFNCW